MPKLPTLSGIRESIDSWRKYIHTVKTTLGSELFLTPLPPKELLRKTIGKFSIIFGTFLVIVLSGNHLVVKQRHNHEVEALQRQESQSLLDIQRAIITRFSTGMGDLLFLHELPELEEYIRTKNPQELRLLESDLLGLLRLREDYDKIRFIDAKGMELMRVDSFNGNPAPIPVSQLQDKSNRNFFKNVSTIKPGEVYVSAFDLNEEQGQLERPFKPTFRLISGVFSDTGKGPELIGILIINYLGKSLFDELEEKSKSDFKVWLLDHHRRWMKEPGCDFVVNGVGKQVALHDLALLESAINANTNGQKVTPEGIFTFSRFSPLQTALNAHPNLAKRLKQFRPESAEEWTIVSQITPEQLAQLQRFSHFTNALVLMILLAPGSIGAWFLAQSLVLKNEADRKSNEARETLQQITDSIPGAVYKLTLSQDGVGIFQFLSRGAREIFGLERSIGPLRYDQITSLIIPGDKTEFDESLKEAFQIGGPWTCEFRIYDGNACLKWIRASAALTRLDSTSVLLSGIFTDITSLKVAEMKRRASEERLDLALQAANDGLWDWNVAEGTTYFSPRWMQMLGYEPHELPHHFHTWKSLIHPDDLKPTMKALSNNIENKCDHYEVEFRMRTKGGGWRWLLSRGAVVRRDPLGRPERIVGTHTDISDRKDLEKNLKAAKDAAEHANKAKSSFLAVMSHELRTPMNSVCGFADSLKRTTLDHQQMDYAEKIQKSAGKLLFIINDILDYSKIEAGRLKLESISFDFAKNVRESVDLLRPQLEEKKLHLDFQVEGALSLPVKSDPTRLHQIIVNLIANAIKFTDHGVIRVKIVSRELDGNRYEIETSVRDSGIGMSIEQQSALFQPFSQIDSSTTRKYGGTGLGLAICKRLCEIMNGHIWVVSQPGEGSTFTFSLKLDRTTLSQPAKSAAPKFKASADTNRPRAQVEKFGWKVLWADHDEVSRMVASQLLTDINCESIMIEDDGRSLTPEMLKGCTAALFDESMIKSGLFAQVQEQVKQLDLHPFYFLGLTENSPTNPPQVEGIEVWVTKPVDIRGLSRALAKAAQQTRSATLTA